MPQNGIIFSYKERKLLNLLFFVTEGEMTQDKSFSERIREAGTKPASITALREVLGELNEDEIKLMDMLFNTDPDSEEIDEEFVYRTVRSAIQRRQTQDS
jgi:hypothetical protein